MMYIKPHHQMGHTISISSLQEYYDTAQFKSDICKQDDENLFEGFTAFL